MRSGRRFLLVQHRRIGDVLMCTPALRALREAHPEARIDFLTEPASVPVLERNPHLSNLLVSRGGFASQARLLRETRRARYDAVVDFYGSPRSAWTVALSGAPRRIGFPYRARRIAYTEAVGTPPRVYSALSRMHLVKRLGAWSDDLSLDFPISDNDRAFARRLWEREGLEDERVVAMFPSSRRADKVWPAERFSAVADALARGYGFRALLLWGPGEEEDARAVRALSSESEYFIADYTTPTLAQARAIIERCVLFVGNDSGLKHVAVAAGVPTVAVFGPADPLCWTPPDDPRHKAVFAESDDADAARRRLECVTVEMVLSAVDDVLSAVRPV